MGEFTMKLNYDETRLAWKSLKIAQAIKKATHSDYELSQDEEYQKICALIVKINL